MTNKIALKIYVEKKLVPKLIAKANACGYSGRGAISKYITKCGEQIVIFPDPQMLELLLNKKKI